MLPVHERHPILPPPRSITRFQLTVLLLVISLVPPIFVVSMVATHKPPPEPKLDARITQDFKVLTPRKTPESPRILPCIVVTNPTQESWRNMAVSLNKEFFYYHPGTVEPESSIDIPLEFFVTKGGNVAFQPGSEFVHRVTVYAQIASGYRAVSETYYEKP